ncbi:MAG TPA: HlyD family efflux transporter periplasmic adaptor subunit, partial [Clostridia bacterium]|nr:HlyD family efflux transporter periplasmic adaptor subunit [Clostridia bacterium]
TYNEMQTELKNLKSDLKQLELNYKSTSKKLEEGVVYSTINGVVSGLIEPEQAQIEGTPLMTVAGGDGYLIRGTMSELDFGQIEVGQTVDIMSWMSGTQCQGTITEISNLPATSSYYYGSGNTNVSYYPFTVYVSGEYSLREGEYVEMTLSYESNGADTLYIERAYVRQEDDGRSYVYADKEGRLEKRYINTGKLLWGYYLEIKSGLTAEDLVAFPYGSDVKEGVKTLDVSDSEFGYYPMY